MSDKTFRKILIVWIPLLIVLLVLCVFAKVVTSSVDTSFLSVSQVEVTEDYIHISGMADPILSKGYYGFSYRYEKDMMYIKPHYFWLGDNHFDIKILKNTGNTRQIYLQGTAREDLKLIWSRPER